MKIVNIERTYNKYEDKYEIVMWVKDKINYCTTPIVVEDTAYANSLLNSWNSVNSNSEE
tara:strand:+ start:19 stop:195 length:177 start_codon:yes stop_codon:yes gene_type:complete